MAVETGGTSNNSGTETGTTGAEGSNGTGATGGEGNMGGGADTHPPKNSHPSHPPAGEGSQGGTDDAGNQTLLVNDMMAQRDSALIRAHILEAVLKGHNISTNALSKGHNLTVKGGKVIGEYQYNPPGFKAPPTPPKGSTGSPGETLTVESIKNMTPEEINKNWDKVRQALR